MNYSEASSIRRAGLGSLITDRMIEGRSVGSAIGRSLSDTFKAQAVGLKQKVHPVYLAKKMTGSNLAATLVGKAMGMRGRKIRDVSGQTHFHRHLQLQGADVLTDGIAQSDTMKILKQIEQIIIKRNEYLLQQQETMETLREERLNETSRRDKEIIDVFLLAMNKPTQATKTITQKPSGGLGIATGLIGAGAAIYTIYNQFYSSGAFKLPEVEFDIKDFEDIEWPTMEDFEFDFGGMIEKLTKLGTEVQGETLPKSVPEEVAQPEFLPESEVEGEMSRLKQKSTLMTTKVEEKPKESAKPLSGDLDVSRIETPTATPMKPEVSVPVPPKAEKQIDKPSASKPNKGLIMPDVTVAAAIQKASQQTGVPEPLLYAIAKQESSFNPNATPIDRKTGKLLSSAKGLYQFINSTWSEMVKRYGNIYPILKERSPFDPEANALAGALFIKENASFLKRKGLRVDATSVYTAHFLGPGGANTLFSADTNKIAADILPKAAGANPHIFYKNGKRTEPKTVGEVIETLFQKVGQYEQKYALALNETPRMDGVQLASLTKETTNMKSDMKRGITSGGHTTVINNSVFTSKTNVSVQSDPDVNPMLGKV